MRVEGRERGRKRRRKEREGRRERERERGKEREEGREREVGIEREGFGLYMYICNPMKSFTHGGRERGRKGT